ncbi:MAG: C-terminal binding protein [Thalassobaculales bacterium]
MSSAPDFRVLIPDPLVPACDVEAGVLGPKVALDMHPGAASVAEIPDEMMAAADGMLLFRYWLPAEQIARFRRCKVVVRLGVGYDRIDRAACAAAGITVCNLPDYGTTEVADHAMALALALRRGVILHHDAQRGDAARGDAPAPWHWIETPLIRRSNVQRFGILGLGRIGTAVALRAKAFGFQVAFFDPHLPNGVELALGIARCRSLEELLGRSDILSVHAPLTPETRGLLSGERLSLLPRDAVLVNTARGPIVDVDGVYELLKSGHLAAAGLDVLPVEPPLDPPALLKAYRAREKWLDGRLVVTPHSAFHSPEAWHDIRVKGAETMRAVLIEGRRVNVIDPSDY